MHRLDQEIVSFLDHRRCFDEASRQTAALRLLCGIDLSDALARTGEGRERVLGRIRRAMERERLKGVRGHAGYDLDRHIALKRSFDRIRGGEAQTAIARGETKAPKENGARRRRSICDPVT